MSVTEHACLERERELLDALRRIALRADPLPGDTAEDHKRDLLRILAIANRARGVA